VEHRVGTALLFGKDGARCDCGCRVPRYRLKQNAGELDADLLGLLGDNEAILGIGDNDGCRIAGGIGHALQRLLKQADLTRQRQELLGAHRTRQRPQPRSLATGKNHWNYTNAHHAASPLKNWRRLFIGAHPSQAVCLQCGYAHQSAQQITPSALAFRHQAAIVASSNCRKQLRFRGSP